MPRRWKFDILDSVEWGLRTRERFGVFGWVEGFLIDKSNGQ